MSAAVAPAMATSPSEGGAVGPLRRACPLCGAPGTKVCAGCSKVGYCSKEHQREHWKEHKSICAQKHKLLSASTSSSSSSSSSSSALSSVSSLSPPKEEVVVTWQDQQSINLFSRLNTRLSLVDDQLRSLTKSLANIVDAADSIETLLDDDCVMIQVGEVYVRCSNEEAEAHVTAQRKKEEESKAKLLGEKADIEQKMGELKKALYGKFGKAINLENAEQTIND